MVRVQPVVADAALDEVRRLAEQPMDGTMVLSVYVDLDPTRFGTAPARESQRRSLLDQVHERIEALDLTHQQRESLRSDRERVAAYLQAADADGAQGLAVFSSVGGDLFEVLRVSHPVEHRVEIGPELYVEPLVRDASTDGWCVLLVNRRVARVLRGSVDRLREIRDVEDVVHGQHAQGGWSQGRYERSVETDVDRHLDRVSGILTGLADREPFRRLLIAGPEEIVPRAIDRLHPSVRRLIAGRFEVDVQDATEEQVLERSRPLMEDAERRNERELLDELAQRLGSTGRAVAGLDATFAALVDRRVDTLLIGTGTGWNDAIAMAVAQSADVRFTRYHDDLERLGGVAALLRF
jgi:peptide chain release factor subunit 1